MRGGSAGDEEERRREGQETAVPEGHELLPPEVAQRLQEVAGFTAADLFERRGALTSRGLAHLLEPGDEVLEVLPDHARIRKMDGSLQTFWNLERLPAWVRAVSPPATEG